MGTTITTTSDVRTWLDNTGWNLSNSETTYVVGRIQGYDHPAYGRDWSAWLDGLDVVAILDRYNELGE